MPKICILGGGSLSWTPGIVCDLMHRFPNPLDLRLHDIDHAAARTMARVCRLIAKRLRRRQDRIRGVHDRAAALRDADAVLITISTGGLEAMAHDLAIPEQYGIFATVGDTTGPGGWARAVRNIPVFLRFARDVGRYCPRAFIVNYTNPMAALTAALQHACANPVVGLCHAYFETKDVIQRLFGLKSWRPLSVEIAGMNHFTWVTDFRVQHRPGYPLLRQKLRGRSLRALLPKVSTDEIGHRSAHAFCAELFDAYGYICYPADRHTSEFVSYALTNRKVIRTIESKGWASGTMPVLDYCNLTRTSIENRRNYYAGARQRVRRWLAGAEPVPTKRSRETGSDMIAAYLENQPFTDAVNVLNRGQIPGLPAGACVETLGTVDAAGVHPLTVRHVPPVLLEVMRPHANCQAWITEGAIAGDKDRLLHALYHDPACAHLTPSQVRAMARELLHAHRSFVHPKLRPSR